MKDNAKVIIRVRPLLKFQDEPAWITTKNSIKCLHSKAVKSKINKSITSINDSELQVYSYNFDRVVQSSLSSQKIYKAEIRKLIEKSMINMINTTVVAYGQTCSGKTYTLLGVKQAPGFIPCIFRDIFNSTLADLSKNRYTIKVSYTQIYNEKLIDLLNPQQKQLKILKDDEWGNQLSGAHKQQVSSFEQCLQVLDKGEESRKYAQKTNHDRSSRSHTILKIYIQKLDEMYVSRRSIINIVDLAGSQRLSIMQNMNQQTAHINKSLFLFSNVLSKLSQNSEQHIPYRDSKLTRLLQNSLTRNSNLAIVFCISPSVSNFNESVSTLRLAVKAKKVQISHDRQSNSNTFNIQQLHEIIKEKDGQIKKLKEKIHKLNKQIQKLEQKQILKQNKNQKNQKNLNSINNYGAINSNINNKVQTKVLIVCDHENFMLSIDNTIRDINNQKIAHVKADFVDKLAQLYQQFSEQIVQIALELGYDQNWLKMQDICFVNLFYDRAKLLQYRVPLLKQACSTMEESDQTFSQILKSYTISIDNLLKSEVGQQDGCSKNNKKSTYCHQSPIFQESTIEVVDYMDQLGSKIIAWGCKKDHRVFKSQKETNLASECDNIGNIKTVVCGAHHTLALNQNGDVFGWGKNQHKQICPMKSQSIAIPKQIINKGIKIKNIAAGWGHSLLLSDSGKVYSFGFGEDGQLGLGNLKHASQPTKIQVLSPVLAVYAGHSHSGFIDNQYNYYAFGFNKDFRLMVVQSKQVKTPKKVNLKGIVKAALGITHTCLLTKYGQVFCGGVGTNGELGINLTPQINGYQTLIVPQKNYQQNSIQKICPVVCLQEFRNVKVIDVSCGECSTAVITEDYQLYTFGKTTFDRLGHTELKVTKILDNVDRVQMGYRHGFAWNSKSSQVYGWGFNMYNQLGTSQPKDIKKPQVIHAISSKQILQISTGFFHSVAVCK